MKPYGKLVELRHGCMCCGTNVASRQTAKAELRKIIEEETILYPPENCKVCNIRDFGCICFKDLDES